MTLYDLLIDVGGTPIRSEEYKKDERTEWWISNETLKKEIILSTDCGYGVLEDVTLTNDNRIKLYGDGD